MIDWETEIMYRGRPLSDYRASIIEECARVAEKWKVLERSEGWIPEGIADAIRALEDKP